MTQPTDRPAPCLLDACARQCTTECREAINRAWTSLRGTQRAQPTDRHGIDQLTSDQLDQLYADLDELRLIARMKDGMHRSAEEDVTTLHDRAERAEQLAADLRAQAITEQKRRAKAEATLTAVRAIADRWAESDVEVLRRAALVLAKEALDQHGQTPKETT